MSTRQIVFSALLVLPGQRFSGLPDFACDSLFIVGILAGLLFQFKKRMIICLFGLAPEFGFKQGVTLLFNGERADISEARRMIVKDGDSLTIMSPITGG